MEHTGKHALVTGGGTGIGAAIATALAQAGAEVTITGRRSAPLHDLAAKQPRLHPLVMDVSDETSVHEGVAQAAAARGPVRICVANAGIATAQPFARTRLNDWREIMTTNLDGVFLTLQAALATLPKDMSGRMIGVSSIAGVRGLKNGVTYTASKYGVIGLMRGLSEEYMGGPVTFNALCPGYVDTDIVRGQVAGLQSKFGMTRDAATAVFAAGNRHGRLLGVDEIAAAAMWLASDGAQSVNGQTLEISGGQTCP
ncbi:NAD(P)-dependent dehydrogenase, short-chain alcohol dehydrogenase family [Yoonia tamlensis]|uniref:NAD(P)-dependent dehydrogenase, short-chain alcohol dehydrogenase family n=1 Tax=Yoonia tamlensis TaxID=390270 RepID=A0A1I6GK62_9RHOB|nr:SDR family oxidoreductase [Yoonia tamlensis]SFR42568.1 NAD(P)-dependent dehydrogenase, short-chain alcohol dehydrogenase family [Yoonia tamlensis]